MKPNGLVCVRDGPVCIPLPIERVRPGKEHGPVLRIFSQQLVTQPDRFVVVRDCAIKISLSAEGLAAVGKQLYVGGLNPVGRVVVGQGPDDVAQLFVC